MEKGSDPTMAAMNSDGPPPPPPVPALPLVKKDRHIVAWTPEEDDLLREQIALHGTDNWTSIAAQLKDKTSRQCRRRWYSYLNSECKKGGWSVEEDMLLCEAQKIFGNRWTEIAKVVSGRTDNAVKNRFSTLCKKRAKHEELLKENVGSCGNTINKRVVTENGYLVARIREPITPSKQIRYCLSDLKENKQENQRLLGRQLLDGDQLRPPLAALLQNINVLNGSEKKHHVDNDSRAQSFSSLKTQGTFLKRDDPKLVTLLQQAELLSSLATKLNAGSTNLSLEDAWKELHDYLIQTEENGALKNKISGMASVLDDLKDLIEDLKSSKEEDRQSLRQSSKHTEDSHGSSECSTGSTTQLNVSKSSTEQKTKDCLLDNHIKTSGLFEDDLCSSVGACPGEVLSSSENFNEDAGGTCNIPNSEFASPLQMIRPFRSSPEGIPSPKFTASERRFLLTALGLSSPGPKPDPSQQPSCKRSLVGNL
ncbi:transcription factor MYB124-like [Typha latifolia]|uniref:transcription factor MYB124-like n=1 Tax=Typha latifolia TaxID=4733 RepID=UPI003C2B5ED6